MPVHAICTAPKKYSLAPSAAYSPRNNSVLFRGEIESHASGRRTGIYAVLGVVYYYDHKFSRDESLKWWPALLRFWEQLESKVSRIQLETQRPTSQVFFPNAAFGYPGGSVLEAILADGEFTPRAITRNVASEAAQALSRRGIEIAQGDLSDVNSLRKAFTGCEGVFCVSSIENSCEHLP